MGPAAKPAPGSASGGRLSLRLLLALALLLTGCIRAPTALLEQPPTPTAPPAPGASAVPRTVPRTVIRPENAADLQPQGLSLPEWPQEWLWLAENAALPSALLDGPGSAPDLLLWGETALLPLWLTPPALGQPLPLPPLPGRLMAAAPDGSSLLVQSEQTLRGELYNLRGELLHSFDQPALAYTASYSPDGRFLAVGSGEERVVFLYDLQNPAQPAAVLSGFESAAPVYHVLVSPGGQSIAWIARASLQFQDTATGQMGGRLGFTDFIGAAAFTPDEQRLALVTPGRVEIYSAPGAEMLAGISMGEPVHSVAFSPDGRLLAAAFGAGVQFFDAQTLAPVARVAGSSPTGKVSFSPGGEALVTLHDPPEIKVWRLP
jgi:hypothetical protein